MMTLTMLLIIIIAVMIGALLLYVLTITMYKKIFPHRCTIQYIRQNNRSIRAGRFRLSKDKQGDPILRIPFWQGKLVMPKPHESYFGSIGKKNLYCELVVPDNGKAYCIKPNFDALGKIITYQLDDRDVMASAKQELRQGVHKYMWKSDMMQMLSFLAIMGLIIISLLSGFWTWKMQTETSKNYKEGAAAWQNGTAAIANSLQAMILATYGTRNGTIYNPIPINLSSVR